MDFKFNVRFSAMNSYINSAFEMHMFTEILNQTQSEEMLLFPTNTLVDDIFQSFALKNASGAFCSADSAAALRQPALQLAVRDAFYMASARNSPRVPQPRKDSRCG
jgi:hypothetical protein